MWYLILAVTGHMGEEVVPHIVSRLLLSSEVEDSW